MMSPRLTGFMGFPEGKLPTVAVPRFFFSHLLPQVDDLAELKLTLYCMCLLNAVQAEREWLWADELRCDAALLAMMTEISALYEAVEILEEALQRAVQRQSLLLFSLRDAQTDQAREAVVLNTARGRQLRHEGVAFHGEPEETGLPATEVSRPFQLYQQNIGLLTPLVADQLRALEEEFPIPWICEAITIAVHNNKRALAYVEAILERWAVEGRMGVDDAGEQMELDLESS